MRFYGDIDYVGNGNERQYLDLNLPDCDAFPVVVMFHGGGLETGSKEHPEWKDVIRGLVEQNIGVVAANYRLYPNAAFPQFFEDAAAAVAWTVKHIGEYGACRGIFVGGYSAGGYIAQMLCFNNAYLRAHGVDADGITGYIMDAGQPTAHFNVLRERGVDTRRVVIDETAPLYFVEDGRRYPPMKILVSDNDIPNRLEQTVLLVSTLKQFGYDAPHVDFEVMQQSKHCEYLSKSDEDGNNVLVKTLAPFIKRYTEE